MLTLGVETSCDETSFAVLKNGRRILSNVVSSSLFRHKPFGGIVPEIASRHSLEQVDTVFHEALKKAKVKSGDLDLIAVTEGPGLIGSLLVGVCFAKSLSYQLGIPLVGVNHLEAHLVAPFIIPHPNPLPQGEGRVREEPSRFVGLLVSGGHTCLTLHEKGHVTLLGETVDDAVGEAYDKVGKILGLGYPGGPVIDQLAYEGDPEKFRFTKPKQKNRFDFSFSGIKTAVLYTVQKQKNLSRSFVCDMAAGFQKACVHWLVEKTLAAASEHKVQDVVVGGGVSANSLLRKSLAEEGAKQNLKVWIPPLALTTDNAAMIGARGFDLYRQGKRASFQLTGNPSLKMAYTPRGQNL